jgi:hypothetical protein
VTGKCVFTVAVKANNDNIITLPRRGVRRFVPKIRGNRTLKVAILYVLFRSQKSRVVRRREDAANTRPGPTRLARLRDFSPRVLFFFRV